MRVTVFRLLLLVACACAPAQQGRTTFADVMKVEFLSMQSPAPSVHASTIVEQGDTLVAAWFGGSYESANDVSIWLTRRVRGAWDVPREVATGVAADGRRVPTWNPVLFAPDASTLELYYKAGPNPREWWGMVMRSHDAGATWTTPARLPEGILGPIKDKPVRLASGVIVSPSSTEAPDRANAWRVHFERSADGGRSWQRISPAARTDSADLDAIQPTILVHRDGRLQALMRTRGPGRIAESWSTDEGRTWSAPTLTALPNPNAGIDAVTLRDGRFLLVYNPVTEGRTPLVLAISSDGVQWEQILTLEGDPGEYSYPAIIESASGTIEITWTWKRERIKHVSVHLHGP